MHQAILVCAAPSAGFLRCFGLKMGINFAHFGLSSFWPLLQKDCPGGKVPFLKKKTTQKENEQEMSYPYWYSTKHSVFKKS